MKHGWPLLIIGLMLNVATVSARTTMDSVPPNVRAKIDSTTQAMYGPGSRIKVILWYGPFRERGNAGQAVSNIQIEQARERIALVRAEEDPVWFGSTSPMRLDPAYSKHSATLDDLFQQNLRIRRATVMNDRTGSRGVLATAQNIGLDKPGAYLVIVRRPDGMPSLVPGRELPLAAYRDTIYHVDQVTVESDFILGPMVGAMYLNVDGNVFFSPLYGALVRKNQYMLFGGEGRTFNDHNNDDRFRFVGLRVGQPNGLFFQVMGVDARQLILERDVYTHRATGATGGIGFQWNWPHAHLSVAGGGGGFNLITPQQYDSKFRLGFYLAGQTGLTF